MGERVNGYLTHLLTLLPIILGGTLLIWVGLFNEGLV
jgi:hypothetical protein